MLKTCYIVAIRIIYVVRCDMSEVLKQPHPGARNPKTRAFSLKVTDEINARVERLADKAGMNKSTMAAMAIAAGLNILEHSFMVGVEKYVEQASADKLGQMEADIKGASSK